MSYSLFQNINFLRSKTPHLYSVTNSCNTPHTPGFFLVQIQFLWTLMDFNTLKSLIFCQTSHLNSVQSVNEEEQTDWREKCESFLSKRLNGQNVSGS